MLRVSFKIATFVVLAACTAVATAQPANFVDLGKIGVEGDFTFHTEGSLPIPVGTAIGLDTELGLWDAAGVLIASNDDGIGLPGAGNGFESLITATLTPGMYFLGGSIFNSVFADGFLNTNAPFGAGESADLQLTVLGGASATTTIGGDQPLDQTAFFKVTVSAIPEPTTATVLGMTGLALISRRRRA